MTTHTVISSSTKTNEGIGAEGWTLDTAFTLACIYSLQEERGEKTEISLIDTWLPLSSISTYTILGSFAWSSPSAKKKWIHIANARLDRTWGTPADRARDYLKVREFHKKRRRVTTAQYQEVIAKRRSHPLYAKPQIIEDAVYIDIRSAYWSILSIVGWDVDYFPGKWIGVRSSVADFPFKDDKLARNSLVSVGLPGTLRVWTGEKLSFVKRPNAFINMVLWALIHDVLHGVAADAVHAGAVYVFTDGFIAPAERETAIIDAINRWGLPAGVKQRGRAVIRGVGNYDIGTHIAKMRRTMRPHEFNNLHPVRPKWLREKMASWASRQPG